MYKNFIFIYLVTSVAYASEISISISEDLVNDYLKIIGNHEVPKGPKGNQAVWSIKNPHVKFEYGSADFLTTITFRKGKIKVDMDIKNSIIYFEKGVVRVALDLEYK